MACRPVTRWRGAWSYEQGGRRPSSRSRTAMSPVSHMLTSVAWPDSDTVCEPAVSLKVRVALRAPAAVGRKVTLTWQVDRAGRFVPGHELLESGKSPAFAPLVAAEFTWTIAVVPLVSVTTVAGPEVPTFWFAKVTLDGLAVTAPAPGLPTMMRPMAALVSCSVNQMLPSGPDVMPVGWTFGENAFGVGTGNSMTDPLVVIRPMALLPWSMNHRAPSDPAVMAVGAPLPESDGNSVTTWPGVILPMRPWLCSVNQRLPSGPAAMPTGPAPALLGVSAGRNWAPGPVVAPGRAP